MIEPIIPQLKPEEYYDKILQELDERFYGNTTCKVIYHNPSLPPPGKKTPMVPGGQRLPFREMLPSIKKPFWELIPIRDCTDPKGHKWSTRGKQDLVRNGKPVKPRYRCLICKVVTAKKVI